MASVAEIAGETVANAPPFGFQHPFIAPWAAVNVLWSVGAVAAWLATADKAVITVVAVGDVSVVQIPAPLATITFFLNKQIKITFF